MSRVLLRASLGISLTVCLGAAAQSQATSSRMKLGLFQEVRAVLESEGAAAPRDSVAAVGDTARRCVDLAVGPARSGEFSVRGFTNYAWVWHTGGSKLTWWPTHPQPHDTLTVRIVNARRIEDSVSFRFGQAVRPRGADVVMFPSAARVPRAGPWFFVARAGRNWGCFFFVLPDSAPPPPVLR